MRAYRYPPKNQRKAVIFYLHGYGSYAQANGSLAKYLADFDFEVFAIDQRGFGESEGQRAIIEKTEDIYNDQWLLIFEAIKKFKINQQKTPLFLFGRSFGGLIATNMTDSILCQSMFTGICLLTPYYRLWTDKLYAHQPLLKLYRCINPHKMIPAEFKELPPEMEAKWGEKYNDPKADCSFTVTTGVLWAEEQARALESIQKCSLPLLMVEAGDDEVIRNDYLEQYFAAAGKSAQARRSCQPNQYLKIPAVDHTTVCFETHAIRSLVLEMVKFFNKLIAEKNTRKDYL